ncbi:tRNA (adenosine(37)-N6)-threonylcarbamoyltransferase complex ATPase subunit type 1 TsaE [Candidatus Gottesmanbacteria bacterium]|nr:tRNA (adenosine(37)-N6)-threonylcarbamoyltransferase complex ATPase subunit type 1 TsaE [Candidatus Gottesmanbacteria bacterium]
MKYISESYNQTRHLGRQLAAGCRGGEVLCLYGDLGSGKTTFIQGLINFFLPGKRILSPTFIIVRHYYAIHPSIKNIYHVDLYRTSKIEEIIDTGISEFIQKPDNIIVAVEWADKLAHLLPAGRIDVNFSILSANKREIKIDRI